MEIDLELPSGREGKLDAVVDINNDDNEGNLVDDKIMEGEDLVNLKASSDNKSAINSYMPQNGMEFETKEAAYSFYREYARLVGFGITIKASRRSKKSGKFIDIKIVCSRFGSSRQSGTTVSPRSCHKTDCKANMHIKKRPEGNWLIYSFVGEHNHEMCFDDFNKSVRGKKNQETDIVCSKKGLQLVLDEKDVRLLLDYFMHMQGEAPGFYYVIDFDEEACMRNMFWVDPKGRHEYVPFSDVVFFDTHYIKSKYKIPFVPVIGVNNHFQFILLGCAFIGDETASTFIWLMRTWLRSVNGRSPKVVITDNNKSLVEATLEVFPNAFHCFCPWYVLSEVSINIGHELSRSEVFSMKFEKCMYRSWTNEEFEKRWHKMVKKFDLMDNKWFQSLYENRRKWIPSYMRDVFLGGFCTVERSQSVASFFDKYLQKETTIVEFIDRYKLFLHERCEEEVKAEIETWNSRPTLISHSPFEKQMSKIYTCAIFRKFQAEVSGIVLCMVGKEYEDERTTIYGVDDLERKQNFIVSWNKGKYSICCLCRLFEFSGFLCRHALSVLQLSGISTVPSSYILKRWTRKAKIIDATCQASVDTNLRVQRLNDICRLAIKLGNEGSLSGEAYESACHALEEATKLCAGMDNKNAAQGLSNVEQKVGNRILKVPKRKVSKKRKVRGEAETLTIGIQDRSQNVEQLSHRSFRLHDSYISEQDLQEMGHLNSLSSLQDCYYSDQSLMQGVLGQISFRPPFLEGCFEQRDSVHNVVISIKSLHYVNRFVFTISFPTGPLLLLQENSDNMTSKHLHN